jgi:hypothetical protein
VKKLLLILFLGFPLLGSAQGDDYKKIAQEVCDCITQKDLSSASKKTIEMSLGLCMLESIKNNEMDIEITDGNAMRSFGEKIGVQMAPLCPTVFTYLTENNADDKKDNSEIITVSGKIKSIDENEFLFITVKEENGKEIRMIWLRHFIGSDDHLTNPQKLIGKKVTIKYQPIECYLPKAKGYFAYKEIVELEVQ